MRFLNCFFLAAGFAGVALQAEPVAIAVGDGTINGDRFQPYSNKWEYSVKPPGKDLIKVGIWSDEMVAATVDGHAAFIRKQVAGNYKNDKTTITVNTFDAHTLAPLRREWIDRNPANFTRLKFAGKGVERSPAVGNPGLMPRRLSLSRPLRSSRWMSRSSTITAACGAWCWRVRR